MICRHLMKIHLPLLIVIITVLNAGAQSSVVQITVDDIKDSVGYLGYHFADKRFVKDTAEIQNNGQVLFTSNSSFDPGLYFFYTPKVYFEFIVNEPEIILHTKGGDYVSNMNVIRSEENKIFNEMQLYVTKKRKEYGDVKPQALDASA